MAIEQAPYQDPAAPILSQSTDVDDDARQELFDIFHNSKDHNELARKLQVHPAPDALKQQLFDAKKKSVAQDPGGRGALALERLGQVDPKILDLAETHPNVMKAFMTSVAKEGESEAAASAGTGEQPPKGKSQGTAKTAPTVTPDVPPTPPGHALIRTKDGALHHLPVENIDKARGIDPELQVLHVEP